MLLKIWLRIKWPIYSIVRLYSPCFLQTWLVLSCFTCLCCVSVSLNCQCFACCFFSLIRSFFKYQVLNLVKPSCLGGICFLLYCMTSIEWNLLEVYVKTVRLGHITTIWLWTPINLCRYRYILCSVMTNSVLVF